MNRYQLFLIGAALSSASTVYCDEEECEPAETPHHVHYHLPQHTVEEEYLWQERADSSWAGKRDDNLIDAFLHQ